MSKKLYKSFVIVTIFSVVTRLVSFVYHIFLSRYLGAENIGIFQITCSMLMMFIGISSSGFPVTLSRKIAHYDAIGEYTHSDSLLTSTLIITGIMSSAICAFFLLVPQSLNLLFSNPKCNSAFMLMLPSIIATAVYTSLRSYFWGKKRYTLYSAVELIDEILIIVSMSIILSLGIYQDQGYNALALGHMTSDIVCAIILIIIFLICGAKLSKPKYFHELTISAVPLTTTRLISSLVSTIIALLLPSLLVKSGLDISSATAEYGRMSGMVMPIILAPGTIVSSLIIVLIPDISSDVSRYGMSAVKSKINNAIVFSALISGVFMTIFLAAGKDIGMFLYEDARVGQMIVWSALLTIPIVLNQLTCSLLNTLGKETWTFSTSVISSIGLVTTVILASQSMQIYAYPIGLAVYHILGVTLNSYKLIRTTGISSKYILTTAVVLLSSTISAVLVSLIANNYGAVNILGRICISTVISIVIYLIGVSYIIARALKDYKKIKNKNI